MQASAGFELESLEGKASSLTPGPPTTAQTSHLHFQDWIFFRQIFYFKCKSFLGMWAGWLAGLLARASNGAVKGFLFLMDPEARGHGYPLSYPSTIFRPHFAALRRKEANWSLSLSSLFQTFWWIKLWFFEQVAASSFFCTNSSLNDWLKCHCCSISLKTYQILWNFVYLAMCSLLI